MPAVRRATPRPPDDRSLVAPWRPGSTPAPAVAGRVPAAVVRCRCPACPGARPRLVQRQDDLPRGARGRRDRRNQGSGPRAPPGRARAAATRPVADDGQHQQRRTVPGHRLELEADRAVVRSGRAARRGRAGELTRHRVGPGRARRSGSCCGLGTSGRPTRPRRWIGSGRPARTISGIPAPRAGPRSSLFATRGPGRRTGSRARRSHARRPRLARRAHPGCRRGSRPRPSRRSQAPRRSGGPARTPCAVSRILRGHGRPFDARERRRNAAGRRPA